MVFPIPVSTISGFRSPISVFAENGPMQTPVVIPSRNLHISLTSKRGSLSLTIRHKRNASILPTTPFGLRLEFPLTCLTSILVLNHCQGGRTLRFKLVPSPYQRSHEANNRYTIDEAGRPLAAYAYHDNDYFNLLGLLKDGEFMADVPSEVPMENIVEWATALKDSKYLKEEGRDIQVLFENDITGRISQIKDGLAREEQIEYKRISQPFTDTRNSHDFGSDLPEKKSSDISDKSDTRGSEHSGHLLYSDCSTCFGFKSQQSVNQSGSDMEYQHRWDRFNSSGDTSELSVREEVTSRGQSTSTPSPRRSKRSYGDSDEDSLPRDSSDRYHRPTESWRYYRPAKKRRRDGSFSI